MKTISFNGKIYHIVKSKQLTDSLMVIVKRQNGNKFYQGIVTKNGVNIGTYGRNVATWEF